MERPPRPPRPEQEGFGEATPGEAQSSDPPADPDMIEDDPAVVPRPRDAGGEDRERGDGVERVGGDPDSEPPASPEDLEREERRDQAEGE